MALLHVCLCHSCSVVSTRNLMIDELVDKLLMDQARSLCWSIMRRSRRTGWLGRRLFCGSCTSCRRVPCRTLAPHPTMHAIPSQIISSASWNCSAFIFLAVSGY